MDPEEAEKPVVVASSSRGSRDGEPSQDELAKKVVEEMMGRMMKMMKNQMEQETGVTKADAVVEPSPSAGPSIPPAVEPVEGDLHPVMWLDWNWQLKFSVSLSFESIWLFLEHVSDFASTQVRHVIEVFRHVDVCRDCNWDRIDNRQLKIDNWQLATSDN